MTARASGKPWLESETAQLQAMVAVGADKQQIAAALGRTTQAIEARLYRLKGREPQPSTLTGKRRQRRNGGASFFLS